MLSLSFEPDTCIVRLSGKELEVLMQPGTDSVESRARRIAILLEAFEQVDRLSPQTIHDLLTKKVMHFYSLFYRYWKQDNKDDVIFEIEGMAKDHFLEIYEEKETHLVHVNILSYGGQTKVVAWLLSNMDAIFVQQMKKANSPSFRKFYLLLSNVLEYKGHKITPKTMRATLKRVIDRMAA